MRGKPGNDLDGQISSVGFVCCSAVLGALFRQRPDLRAPGRLRATSARRLRSAVRRSTPTSLMNSHHRADSEPAGGPPERRELVVCSEPCPVPISTAGGLIPVQGLAFKTPRSAAQPQSVLQPVRRSGSPCIGAGRSTIASRSAWISFLPMLESSRFSHGFNSFVSMRSTSCADPAFNLRLQCAQRTA